MHIDRSLLVLFTPRCGSTLLCENLHAVGMPLLQELFQEPLYLNPITISIGGDPLPTLDEYLNNIRHRSGKILHAKLSWNQIISLSHTDNSSPLQVIHSIFRDPFIIYMYRKNRIDQAVSLFFSDSTNVWHSLDENPNCKSIRYDFSTLCSHLLWIDLANSQFENFIAENKLTPLRLAYEDYIERPTQSLQTIFDQTEFRGGRAPPEPTIKKFWRSTKAEYAKRFADDLRSINREIRVNTLGIYNPTRAPLPLESLAALRSIRALDLTDPAFRTGGAFVQEDRHLPNGMALTLIPGAVLRIAVRESAANFTFLKNVDSAPVTINHAGRRFTVDLTDMQGRISVPLTVLRGTELGEVQVEATPKRSSDPYHVWIERICVGDHLFDDTCR